MEIFTESYASLSHTLGNQHQTLTHSKNHHMYTKYSCALEQQNHRRTLVDCLGYWRERKRERKGRTLSLPFLELVLRRPSVRLSVC